MSLRATCHPCSKAYNVPHDRKQWRCKVCDSVLELDAVEPALEESEARACHDCGALNFGEGAFCEECGEPLDEGEGLSPSLTPKEAAIEMRKSMKRVRRLKTFIGINLVFALLVTLGLIGLIVRHAENLTGGEIAIIAVLRLIVLGLSYAAYHYLDRKPFPIVVALAALKTLDTVWEFIDSGPWIVTAVWAALLWWLAVDAAQLSRLAKEHPDLYLARRMRGEHITHKAGRGRRAHSTDREIGAVRTRASGRGKAETNWWVLGGVLATVAGLIVAVVMVTSKGSGSQGGSSKTVLAAPTVSPRAATEAFRTAWNSHSIDALANLTKESLREKMRASLAGLGDRYDWGPHFPQLDAAKFSEPKSGNVRVTFPSEAGEFPVRFTFEDGAWLVRSIKTSPLKNWRP